MAKQYEMICSGCGTCFSSGSKKTKRCTQCGAAVYYAGFTKDAFAAKTPDERQMIIDGIKSGANRPSKEPAKDSNFWISLLNTIANIFIVIGLLISVGGGIALMVDDQAGAGIAVLLGGTVVTLLSVALTKLLLNVAKDIHFLRIHFENEESK